MATKIDITREEVQAYRVQNECGVYEAKRMLLREKALLAVAEAKTIEELKPILVYLLENK